jgi:hypothetical protein
MTEDQPPEKAAVRRRRRRRRRRPAGSRVPQATPTDPDAPEATDSAESAVADGAEAPAKPKRDRKRGPKEGRPPKEGREPKREEQVEVSGLLELRKDGTGFLRQFDHDLAEQKSDPVVPVTMVRKFGLRNGMLLSGRASTSSRPSTAWISRSAARRRASRSSRSSTPISTTS